MSRAKNPKYESMSLEELKANMEKSIKQLEHAIHNKNLLEQRKKLVERKERSHRLIVKGAEFAVIDFKTGKQRSNSHIKQIEKYTSSVREMGVKNVHGCLWYLDENIIEKVN